MNARRFLTLAFIVAFLAVSPVVASPDSAAAFKKLQSLAGDWEGKDDHGMAVRTNFKLVASNTAIIETLSPSGMEEMISLLPGPVQG
jgi:hypothetical protein